MRSSPPLVACLVVLALVTILLGTGVLSPDGQDEPGPTPTGLMALDHGQVEAASGRGRYQYVVIQEYMKDWLPRIKADNPHTKVLVQKNAGGLAWTDCAKGDPPHSSSGVSYCSADGEHPEWFLHDARGERLTFCEYRWLYAADVGNPGYQERWLTDVARSVGDHGFDGVFIDDVNLRPGHCLEGNMASYPSNDSYEAAVDAFMARVGPGLRQGGRSSLVTANVGFDLWDEGHYATARRWVDNRFLDGWHREHWTKWSGTTAHFQADALERQARLQSLVESSGAFFLAMATGGRSATETRRYARVAFLMGWNGNDASALFWRPDGNVDPWSSEWTTDLGRPLGPRSNVNGVWKRRFERGTAYLNPTAQTLTADGLKLRPTTARVT